MKALALLILFLFTLPAFAACSNVTRSNYVSNQILTSSALNTDFNQLVTRINALPGDCITDGTVGSSKLDTSTLQPITKAPKEGCFASQSDSNTISVDKCILAVSGTMIEKTTATTVTWGCSGCSSEVTSTTYYVYATSASTLTLKISTTAPDAYGYNGTDRVLARFYNDASSAIDPYSVDNWSGYRFVPRNQYIGALTTTGSWVSNATYAGKYWRRGSFLIADVVVTCSGAPTNTGLTLTLPSSLIADSAKIGVGANSLANLRSAVAVRDAGSSTTEGIVEFDSGSTTTVNVVVVGASGTYAARATMNATTPITFGSSDTVQVQFEIPVVGWSE